MTEQPLCLFCCFISVTQRSPLGTIPAEEHCCYLSKNEEKGTFSFQMKKDIFMRGDSSLALTALRLTRPSLQFPFSVPFALMSLERHHGGRWESEGKRRETRRKCWAPVNNWMSWSARCSSSSLQIMERKWEAVCSDGFCLLGSSLWKLTLDICTWP